MALTTTQVNQAFLATLGRPAEGSAATWGSTSLSLGALSDSIFIAENTEDFVESLYTEILGRASDAEGKAFWNSLLATTSKEAVLAQFKAAVIAAGQADPSNADYQSFIAQNKAFVQALYTNLLGRDDAKTADAEGIDFWANALATGMSRGDLISAFVSAALSDPNSDDAQTLNAKLSVADAYSAAFKDFGKDVTADEKKAAYAQLVEQMKEVVAGSTVEEFQDAINQFKGQNQDRKTDVFTKGEDDLDASESTAATTFRGTINISNSDKSTIESGDTATGNSEYAPANTLIVDVKSDGKEKDFDFGRDMKATINNVDNLTINNGTADVTLNLAGGDNYTGKVAITGKGDRADVTVDQEVASLNVSTSGTKKAYADTTVAANATLGSFEGSAAVDTLKIDGIIAKSINTGDGKDEVTLGATSQVAAKATINLGAGDDNIIINTGKIGLIDDKGTAIAVEDRKANVTIDGGNGKDTLELSTSIDYVSSIVNVENIKATSSAAISAVAADGLKTTVSGALTIKADYNEAKSISLKDIKSFKSDSKVDTGSLTVQNVTNENITLSSNIKETIILNGKIATSGNGYAEISKFGEVDKIQVTGALNLGIANADGKKVDLTRYNAVKDYLNSASGDVVAINDTNGKASYIWQKIGSEAKLIAVADKTLQASGTNFVLDTTKPKPDAPEQSSNAKVIYDKDNTTIDINSEFYGDGITGQKFKAPAGENDKLGVFYVSGALTVTDSDANKGTVEAYISGKASTPGTAISGTTGDSKVDVYLGVGGNLDTNPQTYRLDASNYTFTNVDAVYANTSGELKLQTTQFATTKLDLSKVGANVKFTNSVAVGDTTVDLASYIATAGTPAKTTADSGDSISFTLASSTKTSAGNTDVKATFAQDTITLGKVVDTKTVAIDLLSDKAIDTIDATANKLATKDTITGIYTVKDADAGDTIKFVGTALTNANTLETVTADSASASHIVAALKAGQATDKANTLYLVNIKGNQTDKYLVYSSAADTELKASNDIVIKLAGNLDVSLSADKLGVVFA